MLDRLLNRLVKWSPERFWTYIVLFVMVTMEATSWLLSRAPLCIVDNKNYGDYYQNGECPTFHVFFIVTMTRILEALGHEWITAISTAIIAGFTVTIYLINRKQLRHAREVERAYVSGGGCKQVIQRISRSAAVNTQPNASIFQQPDGTFIIVEATGDFELHINNHGKTPARLHHAQVGFCDAASPPAIPPDEIIFPQFDNIGPGTQSRLLRLIPIPQGRFTRTAVFGRFYWDDIWGRHWSSGFIYEIPGGPVLPNGSLSIEAPAAYTEDRREQPRAFN